MINIGIKTKFNPDNAGYKSIDDMLDAFNTFKSVAAMVANDNRPISFDEWYTAAVQVYQHNHVIDSPDREPLPID